MFQPVIGLFMSGAIGSRYSRSVTAPRCGAVGTPSRIGRSNASAVGTKAAKSHATARFLVAPDIKPGAVKVKVKPKPKARTGWRAVLARQGEPEHGHSVLATLAVVAIVCTGLFFAYGRAASSPDGDFEDLYFDLARGESDFALGDVRLGMTVEDVQAMQPRLAVTARDRDTVGDFRADGARHMVWFLDRKLGGGAWRVNQEQVLTDTTESEVFARLGQLYGRPATGECNRGLVAASRHCRFQWRLDDGIHVSAISRVSNDKGTDAPIRLTTTATDTFLEAVRDRVASTPRRRPVP